MGSTTYETCVSGRGVFQQIDLGKVIDIKNSNHLLLIS